MLVEQVAAYYFKAYAWANVSAIGLIVVYKSISSGISLGMLQEVERINNKWTLFSGLSPIFVFIFASQVGISSAVFYFIYSYDFKRSTVDFNAVYNSAPVVVSQFANVIFVQMLVLMLIYVVCYLRGKNKIEIDFNNGMRIQNDLESASTAAAAGNHSNLSATNDEEGKISNHVICGTTATKHDFSTTRRSKMIKEKIEARAERTLSAHGHILVFSQAFLIFSIFVSTPFALNSATNTYVDVIWNSTLVWQCATLLVLCGLLLEFLVRWRTGVSRRALTWCAVGMMGSSVWMISDRLLVIISSTLWQNKIEFVFHYASIFGYLFLICTGMLMSGIVTLKTRESEADLLNDGPDRNSRRSTFFQNTDDDSRVNIQQNRCEARQRSQYEDTELDVATDREAKPKSCEV